MDTLVSTRLIVQLPLRRSQREVRWRLLGWARQDEQGDLQMAAGSGSDLGEGLCGSELTVVASEERLARRGGQIHALHDGRSGASYE